MRYRHEQGSAPAVPPPVVAVSCIPPNHDTGSAMLVPARLYIDVMQSLLLAGVFRLALQSKLPVHRARHLVRSKRRICQVKLLRILEQGLILFDVGNGSREGQDDVAYENIGACRAEIGEDGAQGVQGGGKPGPYPGRVGVMLRVG